MLKLSIVIPVYNASKYIKETLDSLLKYYSNGVEIICVDDGSTDKSASIIEKYADKYENVYLIKQENSHAGIARNNGLAHAKGKYVLFLDADDYVIDDSLFNAYEIAKKYRLDCLKFSAHRYDMKKKEFVDEAVYKNEIFDEEDVLRYLDKDDDVIFRLNVTPWSGIYKRKFLLKKKILFNDLICANDLSFYSRVVTNAKRIMVVNEKMVVHRTNVSDSLVAKRASHYDCDLKSVKIIEEQLLKDKVSSEVFRKMMVRMLNNVLSWCEKFCQVPEISDQVYKETEDFLDSFDYSFMDYIKKRFNKIKKHD